MFLVGGNHGKMRRGQLAQLECKQTARLVKDRLRSLLLKEGVSNMEIKITQPSCLLGRWWVIRCLTALRLPIMEPSIPWIANPNHEPGMVPSEAAVSWDTGGHKGHCSEGAFQVPHSALEVCIDPECSMMVLDEEADLTGGSFFFVHPSLREKVLSIALSPYNKDHFCFLSYTGTF
jgi:hypothetical protein